MPPPRARKPYERVYAANMDPSQTAMWERASIANRNFIWYSWNNNRRNSKVPLQRVDPPPGSGINVTFAPPTNRRTGTRPSSDSITYQDWRDRVRNTEPQVGPLIEAFQNQRNQQRAREDHLLNTIEANTVTPEEQNEINDIVAQYEAAYGGSISVADFDNADGAGGSGTQQQAPPTHTVDTDGDTEMAAAAETAPPPAKKRRGDVAGSDGGFDSAQGPMSILPIGGYKSTNGILKFTKIHSMKSWAVPYWNLSVSTLRGGANCVTTPLMFIPWQYACFYLSPEEFDLIPAGSYVDSVSISVMQTVAQTGYPTGGTTASVATTNHPKVLCVAKDLEAKNRGGVNRRLAFTANMIPSLAPTATVESFLDDFIAKQYGTDQTAQSASVVVPGCAHRIPYINNCHWLIYQPNRAQAIARGFFVDGTPITANNCPGYEYFANYITEVNANDTTWAPIDTMSYKFQSAPIGERFENMEIATDDFSQATGNSQYYNNKRLVKGMASNAYTEISEEFVGSTEQNIKLVTYKSAPMEYGAYYGTGDAPGKPARQPSYHIGMRSIDKNDPTAGTSRSTTFVQANIQFEITATMTIRLPSYPNRFVRPKFYNVSLENTPQTIPGYPQYVDPVTSFGLYDETSTAPSKDAADRSADGSRPRRSLPHV